MDESNIRPCGICLLGIDLKKENYVRLTDYKKGEFFLEGFYHTDCYNKRIQGDPRMKKMALALLGKTNKLMKNMGVEEEYEVKI